MKMFKFSNWPTPILCACLWIGCQSRNKPNQAEQHVTPPVAVNLSEKMKAPSSDPESDRLDQMWKDTLDNFFKMDELLNACDDLKHISNKGPIIKFEEQPDWATQALIEALNKTKSGNAYLNELKNSTSIIEKNSPGNFFEIENNLLAKDIGNGKFKQIIQLAAAELINEASPISKNLLSRDVAFGVQDVAQVKPGVVLPYKVRYNVLDEAFDLIVEMRNSANRYYRDDCYDLKFLSVPYPLHKLEKRTSVPVSKWNVAKFVPVYEKFEIPKFLVSMEQGNNLIHFVILVPKNTKLGSRTQTFFPRSLIYDVAAKVSNMGERISPYDRWERRGGAHSWKYE